MRGTEEIPDAASLIRTACLPERTGGL